MIQSLHNLKLHVPYLLLITLFCAVLVFLANVFVNKETLANNTSNFQEFKKERKGSEIELIDRLVTDIRSKLVKATEKEEKRTETIDPLLFMKYPYHDCLDALIWSKSPIEPQNVFTKEYFADFQALEDEVLKRGKTKNGHIGQGIIGQNIFWKVASQSFINTICETGFNLGHSTVLWMHANPRAHVYSFDIGGTIRTEYADYISKKFPGRFNITWGDSRESISNFSKKYPNIICDMVVVDGGHSYSVASADLKSFRKMANKDRNVLLADNVEMGGVKKTWSEALRNKWIKEDMTCMYNYTKKYSVGIGQYVKFD